MSASHTRAMPSQRDLLLGLIALAVIALLLAAGGLAFHAFVWVPMRDGDDQVNACEDLATLGFELAHFHDLHGRYPQSLSELARRPVSARMQSRPHLLSGRDLWGTPLVYEVRDDQYVLATLGRDTLPEGIDYWSFRHSSPSPGTPEDQHWLESHVAVCGHPDVDLLTSDLGGSRCCVK